MYERVRRTQDTINRLERVGLSLRRKVFYTILGLALLAGFAVSILHWMGRSALRTQIAEVRAAGDPLTYEEIEARRRVLRDDENGALILERLFDVLRPLSASNTSRREEVPILGAGVFPPLGEPVTQAMIGATRNLLTEYADVIPQLDRLREFPHGRLRLDMPENPLEMDMSSRPHQHVRAACKLKALDAFMKALEGQGDKAVSDSLTMLNIGSTLAEDPTLLSTLTYVGCSALAVDSLQRCLSLTTCASATLEDVDEDLSRHERSDALVWGMWGERAQITGVFEHVRRGRTMSGYGITLPSNVGGWLTGGWNRLDQAKSLALLNRIIAFSKNTVQALEEPSALSLSGLHIDSEIEALSKFYLMTKLLLPSLERVQTLWVKRTAQLRCARAALAAERYRLEHGRWPGSLDDLVPAFFERVPVDPFDGNPLRYDLGERTIVVYSVDENLMDDGGDVEPPKQGRPNDVGFRLLDPELRGRRIAGTESPKETQPSGTTE